MTQISLNTFITQANLAEGKLRIAQGTTDEIVNKGTIGNRIATFFRNVGEALHLVRPGQDDRNARQQDALNKFRDALVTNFGESITAQVFRDTHLDEGGATLTSDLVRQAHAGAKALRAQRDVTERTENARTLRENLTAEQEFAVGNPGEEPTEGFKRIAQAQEPPLDPQALSALARTVYSMRLTVAVQMESRLGRRVVDPERMELIAARTLKEVARLDANGKLAESELARTQLVGAMYDVLVAVEKQDGPRALLDALRTAQLRLKDVTDIEMAGKDVGGEDLRALNEQALALALRRFSPAQRETLRDAYRQALEPDGVLRALNVTSTRMLMEQQQTGLERELNADRIAGIGVISSQILDVTRMLSNALSWDTRATDLDLLVESQGMSQSATQEAREAFQGLLETIPRRQTPGEMLVTYLHETFPPPEFDTGEPPGWHRGLVQQKLEALVRDDMNLSEQGLDAAIARFRQAVDADRTLPSGLAKKIHAALDAMVEEAALHAVMRDMPQFAGVKQEDMWRLFVPGDQRIPSKWHIEDHSEGSLAGLYKGVRMMLDDQRNGQPMTGARLQQLHKTMTENTFIGDRLAGTYQRNVIEGGFEAHFREVARVPQGYRTDDTNLGLQRGVTVSDGGLAELREFAKSNRVERLVEQGDLVDVYLNPGNPEELATYVDGRLEDARGRMIEGNDDHNREVIARTIQDIYRAHPFMDGNTRTIVFIAMNGLLTGAGMSPAILHDPRVVAGHSHAEFVEDIIQGQTAFQQMVG